MKIKKSLPAIIIGIIAYSSANAENISQGSVVIGGYRFPVTLYSMLQSGFDLPLLIENKQSSIKYSKNDDKYIRVGQANIYVLKNKIIIRSIKVDDLGDEKIKLSDELSTKINEIAEKELDENLQFAITNDSSITLDGKQMRLILNLSRESFGTYIAAREFDLDDPTSTTPSGTLAYDFGGYNNHGANGKSNNSGYLNFNSTTSVGIDHFKFDGSSYTGNSLSSDRSGRINAALWERDYKGLRTDAGLLDSWSMQSVGSVSALTGGEIYGFSVGNAANSRKRNDSLSLNPVVAFFPTAGEARIRRDGNLLSIQRFPVGNHEIDTSALPFGIYSIQVDVMSGSKVVSSGVYQINKPFTSNVGSGVHWQFWGGAYDRDKIYNYHYKYDYKDKNKNRLDGDRDKEMMSLVGISVGRSIGIVDWNMSNYMLREQAVSELWASSNITNWVTLNTQAMSATDGTWRSNYGGTLRLPYSIGNVWYNHNRLHSGQFISLNENRGSNWGISFNVPSIGPASGGVITWTEDKDSIYGYKRRRLDYSQGIYAGRYGSVRLRTGIGYNDTSNGSRHYSDRESYAMLDFSIPLGNSISMGVSHSRESGTAMNLDATREIKGDYLKSVSANLSKSFSANVDKEVTGGASVDFDTPFNTNILSYQTDNSGGWSNTLTSQGSLAWSGTHFGAGKGRENAGLLIDTGLGSGEKLTLDVNGTKHMLVGNRNFISLPPYARYHTELLNNADTMDSYDIADGARRTVSVYPGNVVYIQPNVKKIVTVFGRLINPDGSISKNSQIKNMIGLARSGNDGRFVIDVDMNNPMLSIANTDESICSIKLDITKNNGALWIGDVTCDHQNYARINTYQGGSKENETTSS